MHTRSPRCRFFSSSGGFGGLRRKRRALASCLVAPCRAIHKAALSHVSDDDDDSDDSVVKFSERSAAHHSHINILLLHHHAL